VTSVPRDPTEAVIAETRVVRAITVVFGIASVALLGVDLGSVTAQTPFLLDWFTPPGLIIMFAVPPVLAALSGLLSLRGLRMALGGYAIAFLVVVLGYGPSMTNVPLPANEVPWVLGATSLATVAAALAWRPMLHWAYLLVNVAAIGLLRNFSDGNTDHAIALQHALFSLGFTSIFTAIAAVSVRNARAADRVAVEARAAAARASAAEASLRERTRLDALVHDEILSTLLYASMGNPAVDEAVTRQARAAIAHLGRAESGEEPVEPSDLKNRLREATALTGQVDFAATGVRVLPIPAPVAAAFVEAAVEAVRNALIHAYPGEPGAVRVRLRMDAAGLRVKVIDDGVGFAPREVAAHRLGVRVSIVGRLAVVPGAAATVSSRLGRGTTVSLVWTES
jgi:signal transduction histidine kinase